MSARPLGRVAHGQSVLVRVYSSKAEQRSLTPSGSVRFRVDSRLRVYQPTGATRLLTGNEGVRLLLGAPHGRPSARLLNDETTERWPS